MAVNISELMGKSSGAAQAALGLRYAGGSQPPALNFSAPTLAASIEAKAASIEAKAASIEAKAAQDTTIVPVTELSMATVTNRANTFIEDMVNRVLGGKKPAPAAQTGATKQ